MSAVRSLARTSADAFRWKFWSIDWKHVVKAWFVRRSCTAVALSDADTPGFECFKADGIEVQKYFFSEPILNSFAEVERVRAGAARC